MLKRGDGVAGMILVLAQRAASEGPRSTRAVGIIPPNKVTVRCRLARGTARLDHRGRAGETSGLFEHSAMPVLCHFQESIFSS